MLKQDIFPANENTIKNLLLPNLIDEVIVIRLVHKMFIDQARVYVKGGDGGSGIVSFRREKYVPEGGPDGGDGGKGGDVIFQSDPGLRTLIDFRYQKHYKAPNGEHGKGSNMHGKNAKDIVIKVPLGTIVRDANTGEILADFTKEGQSCVIVKGGRGGRGNARFKSNTNKAPRIAEKGEPGEEKWLELELKLLADVGLVGFPNVGKSTILSRVSAAKPEIANYHFTTLTPNLGVVSVGEGESFVLADIPGLIEGTHQGVGLGHDFLRHIERTRLLIHVLDVSGSEGRDPLEDFIIINAELVAYSEKLGERKQLIAANKIDLPDAAKNLEKLTQVLGEKGYEIFPVSAVTGDGLDRLMLRAAQLLKEIEVEPFIEMAPAEKKVYNAALEQPFTIRRVNDIVVIEGKQIERIVAMTDFSTDDSLQRFQRILKKMGVEDALQEIGIKEGEIVQIGDIEFEYTNHLFQ